ncbi:MAG: hypothetical protein WCG45_03715, partial [bacterium]
MKKTAIKIKNYTPNVNIVNNNNLEKMFDKYNYKYTNIYNLEKYFAPLLKSGFGSTFLKAG